MIFKELWKPLPNLPPQGFRRSVLFYVRLFLDLEVSTVYRDLKGKLRLAKNKILEVGSGHQPYRHLVPEGVSFYALDIDRSKDEFDGNCENTTCYDGKVFPFAGNEFDMVFHTEVLEHIFDVNLFLSECHRVLSPGGIMFFTVPFAARFHYIPHDYWRFTPSGLEELLKAHHFIGIEIETRGDDVTVALSKVNALFCRIVFKQIASRPLKLLNMAFWGPLLALPIVFFVFLAQLSLFLKWGSNNDTLGFSVACRKQLPGL